MELINLLLPIDEELYQASWDGENEEDEDEDEDEEDEETDNDEDDKEAFRFMRRCLTLDPTKRPSAQELLEDKWLSS